MSIEGDAILIVQVLQHREVAELRWDGASELIRVEAPERATMTHNAHQDASYSEILKHNVKSEVIKKEIITQSEIMSKRYYTVPMDGDAILSVQLFQHCEVAELWWDGATEIIRGEVPKTVTMTQ